MSVLYDFFRSASGFSLIVGGISLLAIQQIALVYRQFGRLFICAGALFTLSVMDRQLHIPEEIGNILVIGFIYFLSQSLFEISLYVFGGERQVGLAKRVWIIGAVWAGFLWFLPMLDYLIAIFPPQTSIEDGHPVGFLHSICNWLIYIWPISVLLFSLIIANWNLSDLPKRSRALVPITIGLGAILLMLSITIGALLSNSQTLYRLAHSLLEFFLLIWYFFVLCNPQAFAKFRAELQTAHQKRPLFDESEATIISDRLSHLVEREQIFRDPQLRLGKLAKRIHLPSYQLSRFFNDYLRTSFSAWLNDLRISFVRKGLSDRPEARIIDIALESGYATKAIFNTQFRKLVGVSPSQYRKELSTTKDLFRNQDDAKAKPR